MNRYANIVQLADIPDGIVEQLEIRICRRSKNHVLVIVAAGCRAYLGTSRRTARIWRRVDSLLAYIAANFGCVPIDIILED
jgi:hypothetical protein